MSRNRNRETAMGGVCVLMEGVSNGSNGEKCVLLSLLCLCWVPGRSVPRVVLPVVGGIVYVCANTYAHYLNAKRGWPGAARRYSIWGYRRRGTDIHMRCRVNSTKIPQVNARKSKQNLWAKKKQNLKKTQEKHWRKSTQKLSQYFDYAIPNSEKLSL